MSDLWGLCLCRMSVCIRYGPFMSDCMGSVSGPYVSVYQVRSLYV